MALSTQQAAPPKTSYHGFVIDPEGSKDADDGFAIRKTAYGFELAVCITNFSKLVKPHSPAFDAARKIKHSCYFEDHTVHMLPYEISTKTGSLTKNERRNVIAVVFQLSKNFEIKNFKIRKEYFTAFHKLSYEEACKILQNPKNFSHDSQILKTAFQITAENYRKRTAKSPKRFILSENTEKNNEFDLDMHFLEEENEYGNNELYKKIQCILSSVRL